MTVSYKKLWKLLIDKDLMKKDLIAMSGISASSMAKLVNNGNVNVSALVKICEALGCEISDIVELVPETKTSPEATRQRTKVTAKQGHSAERPRA